MIYSETAAAYGLFQVVFAEMHDCLAAATYHLNNHRLKAVGLLGD